MHKLALLSPAVNAGQAPPTEDAQRSAFEQQFGQMAYQAFSAKYPDIVNDVVTFKVLDTDLENSTAVGAFVIERGGEFIYAPAVLSDNQLKPFDLMYVKSKDIFLPLSADWLDEVNKTTLSTMGDGAKLPETVATDVDIRNIVVPPTTGRYSYASAIEVSPWARLHAEASRPLERRLMKTADAGGMAGSGSVTDANYNPEIWSTFVEQFGRIHQSTPGQALDNGTLDLETLAKMYKSHMKTWEMTQNPALAQQQGQGAQQGAQPGMQPGMPQAGQMPQGMASPGMSGAPVGTGGAPPVGGAAPGMGAMPKMASTAEEAARRIAQGMSHDAPAAAAQNYKTWGQGLDELTTSMGKGALLGTGTGFVQAASDRDLGDAPGAMLRGGVYGAVGAPVGGALGKSFGHGNPHLISMPAAEQLGTTLGGIGAGYMGARALPTALSDMTQPSAREIDSYINQYPEKAPFLMRQGSLKNDITGGLKALVKHAAARTEHPPQLLGFLRAAPTTVKAAFALVLNENPKLLKKAADIYGAPELLDALRTPKTEKTAGMISEGGGSLYVYDKKTPAKDIVQSFGSAAPEVFNGILMRGYYFKDTRPKLNLAVQTQLYHDFHECQEPGVYNIYNLKSEPRPALVLVEPFDALESPRNVFPANESKVKRLKVRVQNNDNQHEPGDLDTYQMDYPEPDVERSHKTKRLVIFPDGNYLEATKVLGEQVTEVVLGKGNLYDKLMRDDRTPPTKGRGVFICKRGAHYSGSMPCELSDVSTGSDNVVRGKLSHPGGFGAINFVIDPRSPITRPRRMRDVDLVVIPANWKWFPVKESLNPSDYLMTPKSMQMVMQDALGSMGMHEIVVRRAGESQYALKGGKTQDKVAAIREIATEYRVHASAAEAMLKIAEHEGKCTAHLMRPEQFVNLSYSVKLAQGNAPPMTSMGGPPAMAGGAPGGGAPGGSPQTGSTPGTPPIPPPNSAPDPTAAPPAPPPPSPIDQAFGEVTNGMQQQITQLQNSLNILQTVQQRAQQIQAEQSGQAPPSPPPSMAGAAPMAPPAPAGGAPGMAGGAPGAAPSVPMQGMPPGMPPTAATDPSAAGGAPGGAPGSAIMATESPSSQEIAGQVNPNFLNNAATFQDAGAFDAGAISSLAQNPSLQNIGSQYAPGLENSVDDLGRTLLTLYMQESQLKDQLGDDSFVKLETQLRDTFHNLGDLVLTLTHSTSMLKANKPEI